MRSEMTSGSTIYWSYKATHFDSVALRSVADQGAQLASGKKDIKRTLAVYSNNSDYFEHQQS